MTSSSGTRNPRGLATDTGAASQVTGAAVAIGSGDPAHLAEIKRPSVSLAQWWRHPPIDIPEEDLAKFDPVNLKAARDGVGQAMRSALGGTGHRYWHETLAADLDNLALRFATIMETDLLVVRLESISDDACVRFHADHVRVRLLCTYVGPGTEWITGSDETAARVHRLGTGNVGLFKGLLWAPTTPILHRSPPIAADGGRRLLLVIDAADPGPDGNRH